MRSDGLEGFARTFLLAAFRSAGDTESDPNGHLSRYLEGLIAGTQEPGRDDDESWPLIGDIDAADDQSQVEAASIALALHLTKAATWNALDPVEQDQVGVWLHSALDRRPAPNNWQLFPLTVASFLESVGRSDERTAFVIERGLRLLDGWYRGDGWYSDGDGAAFDHYVGWALHFYPLLHAHLRGDEALGQKLGSRLVEFLGSFASTFDRNGAPLYQGRSMTYRMATVAAIAIGEVTGRTPLSHGQSRRIMSSNLQYFLGRGSSDGLLTLGYHGPHAPSVQRYSGPASPYWASKGFAALLLPETHPVWIEPEAALPSDDLDVVRAVRPAGLLIQSTTADGLVRVHNHGNDAVKDFQSDAGRTDPLYARFAYSTRTGPTAIHNPSDNDLQVQVSGIWSVRRKIHTVASGENWVASWHAPRLPVYSSKIAGDNVGGGIILPSVRIESVTAVSSRAEVRIHRFRNVPPGSPIRLAGWAVAGRTREDLASHVATVDVTASSVDGGSIVSQLHGVKGWSRAHAAIAPYGTAFGEVALVPELRGVSSDGLFVALASLTGIDQPAAIQEEVSAEVVGSIVTIFWHAEGRTTVIDWDELHWMS